MLHFVVQKHQARQLHYDFRLELDGVLKSWAVPKGPALSPGSKRLAVMVEDHPLDYGSFEGGIESGAYGAGTVMVWDAGAYRIPGAIDAADAGGLVRAGLANGRLRIELEGKKLRGTFELVRFKRGGDRAWLLISVSGVGAAGAPAQALDRSVLSNRTMEQITEQG